MASSGERRMVFDTRGKRKHVVRVVYAILALLMGASLFLVIGPFSLADLVGSSTSGNSATKIFDEQVERIEKQLVKSPTDEQQLLALTRARVNAGNSQIEVVSETEVPTVPPGAIEDFEAASESWKRYLKQAGDEPSVTTAQLLAGTFFRVAESSTSVRTAEENVAKATDAQRIVAEQRPSLGSFSSLAIYQYYNGEFAGGDKSTKQAAAKAPSKAEAKNVEKQLNAYRKSAEQFDKQRQALNKAQKEATKQQLEAPIGGLGGTGGSLGE